MRDDLVHRHDGAEHIRHMRDGDDLRARRQRLLERLEREMPSSSTSTHFSTAPLRSRWKCQGTMLE